MFSVVEIVVISLIVITLGLCVFLFTKISSLAKKVDQLDRKFSPLLNYYEEEEVVQKQENAAPAPAPPASAPTPAPAPAATPSVDIPAKKDISTASDIAPKTPPNSPVNDEIKEVNEPDSIVRDVDGKEQE